MESIPVSVPTPDRKPPRLWPAGWILALAVIAIGIVRGGLRLDFQERNLWTLGAGVVTSGLLLVWWVLFSRVRWWNRLIGLVVVLALVGALVGMFRIRAVSGDLLPIFEPRWVAHRGPPTDLPPRAAVPDLATAPIPPVASKASNRPDFRQYLGPTRDTVVTGPALEPDWSVHPPQVIWRQPVGAAWSGFVIVGERALTQEQRGDDELVTCRQLANGAVLWERTDRAKYDTVIAGAGPRQTPVVVGNRVYTLGATGVLNCLDLISGQRVWGTNILMLAHAGVPDFGLAGTPLVAEGRVIVQAGGKAGASLLAFDAATGVLQWSVGDQSADYSSPTALFLAGIPQVLVFTSQRIAAHDPATGRLLWDRPFGSKFPLVANPLAIGSDRVLISAGYGVGTELLEVKRGAPVAGADGPLTVSSVWTSKRLKAKFHHPVQRGGFVYGLDDGLWTCLNLKDGSQTWKGDRYGHGQGLWIGEHYLLMAESGELVLFRPTPEAPNELAKFRVFDRKTWNPIALSGDLLLVRDDIEAVLLQLVLK